MDPDGLASTGRPFLRPVPRDVINQNNRDFNNSRSSQGNESVKEGGSQTPNVPRDFRDLLNEMGQETQIHGFKKDFKNDMKGVGEYMQSRPSGYCPPGTYLSCFYNRPNACGPTFGKPEGCYCAPGQTVQ